jgi:hypothetical protein
MSDLPVKNTERCSSVRLKRSWNAAAGESGSGELRPCYPIDILNITVSISACEQRPVVITRADLERAASMYFTRKLKPSAS